MNCDSLLQAQAISSRSRFPGNVTPICGRTLHIGFFFDGFAKHLDDDLQAKRVSNIGRLFLAHMDSEHDSELDSYRAFYLSGLGARYDTSLSVRAGGVLNRGQSEATNIPDSVAVDQALEAAKDSLNGRSWWQRLKRDLASLKEKPQSALKVFKNMAINTAAEVFEPIRDSSWSAHWLKTGVDVRLEGAIAELNTTITGLQTDIPLRTIKLSIFGFDFGATLARAFVHELLERSQEREGERYYRNARLEVVFAGLFDAVDRTAADLGPLEFFRPNTNDVDDGGLIHPKVKGLLHIVAAHERRFYRRARLLGDRRRQWHEELMPGVSEDIGGGLAQGEQKLSNELALVSLHRMYRAAFAAGVALIPIDRLGDTDLRTAELFIFNDKTPNQQSAYSLVRHYQRQIGRQEPGHDGFILHMRYYIRWLANVWQDYRAELTELQDEEDALHRSQYPDTWPRSGFFGLTSESAAQRRVRVEKINVIRERRTELHQQLGWLEEVNDEAKSMKTRLERYGTRAAGTRQQLTVWYALLSEWLQPQPLTVEIAELFAFFVHDKQVLSSVQRAARSLTGQNFFDIRGFNRPSGTLPQAENG
ncbi:phospholipase effector Tle1 domain-containing protein [Halopseudomonas pelagia]|uniref:phospholipase effector Tle1 domain-containing protein n=1 Tax=Halopseudomonas pelagia TaxID=553151 RepID=UPI0003A4CA44|nr:DUF2235 domain-containing protein [Halopseudomonas pelagia]